MPASGLFAPLDRVEGLPLAQQQAIFDTEAANLRIRALRGAVQAEPPLNWKLIAAGPLLALVWLLVFA